MGSRIRTDEKLFEVIVEVERKEEDCANDEDRVSTSSLYSASIEGSFSFMYPANADEELLKSIKKFVFPFDPSFKSPIVDHFTFVLTDIDGKFKFGFCRLSEGSKLCHCVVSCHPWFEIFYRLLNQFSDLMNSHQVSYINEWIDSLLRINYLNSTEPASNRELTSSSVFVFQVPDATKLMSIPQSRNLTEYYCAVDSKNMMQIFASMLLERRIIITSHKLSKLTACIHTAAHLLFPFHWQHIFIPILPPHLLDFCSAPMPFLIGIHTSLWNRINKDDLSDALVLDADANDILSEFNDLDHFPPDVLAKLKKYLNVKTKMKNLDGDIIPRAFLKVLVIIFGGYRTAFKMNENKEIVFDSGLFLQSRPEHMKNFLKVVLQSQIFQQFIEERLNLIKAKKGYNDAFEAEISTYDSKRVKRKQRNKAFEGLKNYTKKIIKFPVDFDSCSTGKSTNQTKSKLPHSPPQLSKTKSSGNKSIQTPSNDNKHQSAASSYSTLSNSSVQLSSSESKQATPSKKAKDMETRSVADVDDINSYSNMLPDSRDDLTFTFDALNILASDKHSLRSCQATSRQSSQSSGLVRSPSLTQLDSPHVNDVPPNRACIVLNGSGDSEDDRAGNNKHHDAAVDKFEWTPTNTNATNTLPSKRLSAMNHKVKVQQLVKKFENSQNKQQQPEITCSLKQLQTTTTNNQNVKKLTKRSEENKDYNAKCQELINIRRMKLMESTDQWKKRYHQMNVSDIPSNLPRISKRLDDLKNSSKKENTNNNIIKTKVNFENGISNSIQNIINVKNVLETRNDNTNVKNKHSNQNPNLFRNACLITTLPKWTTSTTVLPTALKKFSTTTTSSTTIPTTTITLPLIQSKTLKDKLIHVATSSDDATTPSNSIFVNSRNVNKNFNIPTTPSTNLMIRVSSLARREAFKKRSSNSSTESQKSSHSKLLPGQISSKSNEDDDFTDVSSLQINSDISVKNDDVNTFKSSSIIFKTIDENNCKDDHESSTPPLLIRLTTPLNVINHVESPQPPPLPSSPPPLPSSPPPPLQDFDDEVNQVQDDRSPIYSTAITHRINETNNNLNSQSKSTFYLPTMTSRKIQEDFINDKIKDNPTNVSIAGPTTCINENSPLPQITFLFKKDEENKNFTLLSPASTSHSPYDAPKYDVNHNYCANRNGLYFPVGFSKKGKSPSIP